MAYDGANPRQFWPLFCTTEVPTEFINNILFTCEQSSKHTNAVPDDTPNLFSLISAPNQTHFDKPTKPPLTGDPPHGFINATFKDIGAFLKERLTPEPSNTSISRSKEFVVAHEAFALIDARTLKDETLVLVRWELYDERIDPTSWDDSDKAWRTVEDWTDVRVPVVMATEMVMSLGPDFMVHENKFHLNEENEDVCFRKEADKRKKAMDLQ